MQRSFCAALRFPAGRFYDHSLSQPFLPNHFLNYRAQRLCNFPQITQLYISALKNAQIVPFAYPQHILNYEVLALFTDHIVGVTFGSFNRNSN